MIEVTEKKLDKAINSLTEALELDVKKRATMIELRNTLFRYKLALIPNIKGMLIELEKRFRIDVRKELEEKDPDFVYEQKKYLVISKARQRVMKESVYSKYMPHHDGLWQRWDDFLFFAKKTWEKDREKLIKEGKIK